LAGVDYNPHTPITVGNEWYASRDRSVPLSSTVGRAALVDATTSESADAVAIHALTRQGQTTDRLLARYGVDIYRAADINAGPVKVAYSLPAADVTSEVGLITGPTAGQPRWQMLNDDFGSAYANDYVLLTWNASSPIPGRAILRLQMSPTWWDWEAGRRGQHVVVDLSDKRIIDIRIGMNTAALNPAQPWFYGRYDVQGAASPGDGYVFGEVGSNKGLGVRNDNVMAARYLSMFGRAQHRNMQSLRPPDIDTFEVGGPGWIGVHFGGVAHRNYGPYPAFLGLYSLTVQVLYTTEKRLATGYTNGSVNADPQFPGEWLNVPLESPYNGSPLQWFKEAGNRYVISVRQTSTTGIQNDWRGLDAGKTTGHLLDMLPTVSSRDIAFEGGTAYPTAALPQAQPITPVGTRTPAYLIKLGADVLDDSQPYVRPISVFVWGSQNTPLNEVDARQARTADPDVITESIGLGQGFSTGVGTAEYGIVTVVARNHVNMRYLKEPLTVTLVDSGGTAVGSGVTFHPEDMNVTKFGDGLWYVMSARMEDAAALVAGQSYTLTATSDADVVAPWELLLLTTEEATAATESWGTDVDHATLVTAGTPPVSTPIAWFDAAYNLGQVPPQVTGAASELRLIDVSHGLGIANADVCGRGQGAYGCVLSALDYILLRWDQTILDHFDHYEIERAEPMVEGSQPLMWTPIAVIADPAVISFADVEVLRNRPTFHRIRQVRTDGGFSDWTVFPQQIAHLPEFAVVLASNYRPELAVAYFDMAPFEWEPVDGTRAETRYLYGNDRGIVLREHEARGDTFTRTLLIAFRDPAIKQALIPGGRSVFDPLVTVAHLRDVPYIAFVDHWSRRWCTAPRVTRLTEEEPASGYTAEVDFTEVAGPSLLRFGEGGQSGGGGPQPPGTLTGWDADLWDVDDWEA